MFKSYNDVVELLGSIGFPEFYSEVISSRRYEINYGKKNGPLKFDSFGAASEKYMYESSIKYMVNIDEQLSILNRRANIDDSELILQCIEIFDWGGVQESNIISAIGFHRSGKLKSYLLSCKDWFEDDSIIALNRPDVVWSSGWTKVYSLMFDMTAIYDSRVSAFLNYVLIKFNCSIKDDSDRRRLKEVTEKMISFKGAAERKRLVGAVDRRLLDIKIKSVSHSRSCVANKLASWLIRYIARLEYSTVTQENFRKIDKAAFMLGFDIAQIDQNSNFE